MNPNWNNAELIALVGVAAIWCAIVWWQPARTLVAGVDGRWSTSKTAVALWTTAVLWAFTATLIHEGGSGLSSAANGLNDQYFAVLGIPVAAAVAAKGITLRNIEKSAAIKKKKTPAEPEPNPVAGFAQLFSNDDGNADLLDAQYFVFNLLLLAFFVVVFLGNETAGLPQLPSNLVALTGIGSAGYLAKKTQETG
jgi:hypothetical protein